MNAFSRCWNARLAVLFSIGLSAAVSASATSTFFGSTTPTKVDGGDSKAVEVGMRFQAATDGLITSVRFYKASTNTGTHVGSLWSNSGVLLAQVTFTGESASGWQQMDFATPIPIVAATTYVVSYHAPVGHYSFASSYFTSAVTNSDGMLTAPASSTSNPNGAYLYGSSPAFPTTAYNASNYYVDVVFTSQPGLSIGAVSPAPASLAFGSVTVGSQSTQTVVLSNVGTATANITAIQTTGAGFSFSLGTASLPLVLAVGDSASVMVTFAPTVTGAVSGGLAITNDGTASPVNVSLSGTGLPVTYLLTASPTTLNFGATAVGQTSTLSTTVTNTGTGSVTFSGVSITGTGFSVASAPSSQTLAANASVTVTIAFSPASLSPSSGTLTVNSPDATNGPITVALSGTPVTSSAAAPWIFYTDLTSGPNSGGENNNGTIVTIYGKRFGATQGTSTVTVGGGAAAAYLLWSDTKVSVAIGSLAATGSVVLTTSAGSSNGLPFTVRSGTIYCVSTTGLDTNSGAFPSSCFATIPKAKLVMVGGDIVYIKDGVQSTTVDNYNAAFAAVNAKGTASNPLAFVAYPGAAVTIGTSTMSYGIKTPSISGGPFSHYVIAGIKFLGYEAIEINDATQGQSSSDWRIIGNELTCPQGSSMTGCLEAGSGASQLVVLGNYVHDAGIANSDKTYHGVYFTSGSHDIEVGWNTIANITGGCRAIQFYSTGTSAEYSISVHDNVIHDVRCDAINFAQVDPSQGTGVQAYNNVIYNAGLGPDPHDGTANYACIGSTDDRPTTGSPSGTIQVYNNTLYNCGARESTTNAAAFTKSTNGCNTSLTMNLRNNIIYQVTGETYLYIGNSCSGTVTGSNNVWYGLGVPPTGFSSDANSDPLFVSLTSYDFHLLTGSPGLNGGVLVNGLLRDLDGLARPQGSAFTIGAYEQ